MFLLSARGVEFEVQRDDNKMKSPCIAQKSFSGFNVIFQFLSVEAIPFRLEVLH